PWTWHWRGRRTPLPTPGPTNPRGPPLRAPPRHPPPPPPAPPPPPPPPPRNTRVAPSCISATAPTSAASVVMRRTSRFFTWPSSWAITPCSSSRVQRSSSPRVTATWECSGSVPVAKAFGSGSSTIQMRGRGTPAALVISSTTLPSCRSFASVGSVTSRAPVDHNTLSGPVLYAYHASPSATSESTIPNQGKSWWYAWRGAPSVERWKVYSPPNPSQ